MYLTEVSGREMVDLTWPVLNTSPVSVGIEAAEYRSLANGRQRIRYKIVVCVFLMPVYAERPKMQSCAD